MKKSREKLSEFKSEKEEAVFWDEHDTAEMIDELEPVDVQIMPELKDRILRKKELKKPVTLRLAPSQIDAVKKIAAKKGLSYQTLIRLWITEKINSEDKEVN